MTISKSQINPSHCKAYTSSVNVLFLHKTGIFTDFEITNTTDLLTSFKNPFFMSEPTLVQVFGAGVAQDSTTLTIAKADLEDLGLTPSSTNRAESLLVSMLLQAKSALNETARAANPDMQITISDPTESLTTENNIRYRVASYTIELFKPEGSIAINPMDY